MGSLVVIKYIVKQFALGELKTGICYILHRKIVFVTKLIFKSITKCLNTVLEKYIVTALDFFFFFFF